MNAKPMPWWLLASLKKTTLAITLPPFGIYLRPGVTATPYILEHEAVHWTQYERMGVWRYYGTYLWQLLQYGYKNHPMEVEARRKATFRAPT